MQIHSCQSLFHRFMNKTFSCKRNSWRKGYRLQLFSGRIQEIAEFALQLKDLYEILTGEARPEEPYSIHNYIEFIAETRGHIRGMGLLNTENHL